MSAVKHGTSRARSRSTSKFKSFALVLPRQGRGGEILGRRREAGPRAARAFGSNPATRINKRIQPEFRPPLLLLRLSCAPAEEDTRERLPFIPLSVNIVSAGVYAVYLRNPPWLNLRPSSTSRDGEAVSSGLILCYLERSLEKTVHTDHFKLSCHSCYKGIVFHSLTDSSRATRALAKDKPCLFSSAYNGSGIFKERLCRANKNEYAECPGSSVFPVDHRRPEAGPSFERTSLQYRASLSRYYINDRGSTSPGEIHFAYFDEQP